MLAEMLVLNATNQEVLGLILNIRMRSWCALTAARSFASTRWPLSRGLSTAPVNSSEGFAKVSTRLAARFAARGPLPPMNAIVEGPNAIERSLPLDIEEAHRCAVASGAETYKDPKTGLTVFTRIAHINKGKCCGCRCRHCPYGHANVPESKRPKDEDTAAAPPTAVSSMIPKKSAVYTRTGDKGSSSLYTGERRSKEDLVFHVLGSLDELNSHIGLSLAFLNNGGDFVAKARIVEGLQDIQRRLFHCGAIFATPSGENPLPHHPAEWTRELEVIIDSVDAALPPLTSFILPGGGMAASQLHVCRSTCRRAERCVVALLDRDAASYEGLMVREAATFVNRLSDFFFVVARAASDISQEVPWNKTKS